MLALACSLQGDSIKRNTTSVMAIRTDVLDRMEVHWEVSVKVGGPTRSSFSFSYLRGLLSLSLAARNSSLDPRDLEIQGRNVVIIPDGRAAKIARQEPLFLSLSRVELTFCQIYDACTVAEDNSGDILITSEYRLLLIICKVCRKFKLRAIMIIRK